MSIYTPEDRSSAQLSTFNGVKIIQTDYSLYFIFYTINKVDHILNLKICKDYTTLSKKNAVFFADLLKGILGRAGENCYRCYRRVTDNLHSDGQI